FDLQDSTEPPIRDRNMRRGFSPLCRGWVIVGGLFLAMPGPWKASAQNTTSDAALRDRVVQLLARLETDKPETRDAAMASLIKLGPKVLPLLPDPSTIPAGDRKDRLVRVREALRKAEADINPNASRVTLEGKGIRLSEALQQLQKQTGNPITDLREQL